MAITNLKVSNFKSFKDLDLNLGRLNVVVGANASGKSNLVEVFRFLRTLERENLADAISLHGGPTAITNLRLGCDHPLGICVTWDGEETCGEKTNVRVCEMVYGFSLQLGSPQSRVLIKDDHFTRRWQTAIGDQDIEVTFKIVMSEGKRKVVVSPSDVWDRLEEADGPSSVATIRNLFQLMEARTAKTLLVHGGFFDFLGSIGFLGSSGSFLAGIGIYDIEPHAIKRPHETAGIPRLEENGENLALVLRQILADPEKSRKFHNLLRDILPFAVEIGTEQYLGTSILLKLREKYYDDDLLADLLSDGTVDAAALITALYFEDKDVVIIEEPERNIHPHLISRLVAMMKDASRKKQVIVTTHSPEIVRQAGVENLLLISRDEDGFSTISRPADKEDVRIFLENDLGLDEVFVQELWGPP